MTSVEIDLTTLKQRLAEAEGTIWNIELVLLEYEHGEWLSRGPSLCIKRLTDIVKKYRLSNAPSDYVVVRREDLEVINRMVFFTGLKSTQLGDDEKVFNLKAALEET